MSNEKLQQAIKLLSQVELEERVKTRDTWHERFTALQEDLNEAKANAQGLYDEVKAQGLSFNTIETEGYLRGINDAVLLLERVIKFVD